MTAHRRMLVALRRLTLPALCVLCAAPPLSAAPARLEDDTPDVYAQDGNAPEQDARQEQRRRANDGDWFRAPVQGPQDFPADMIRENVIANTRAAAARMVFRKTESALHATVRSLRRDFETSQELRDALAAEKQAWDALEDARRDALRDVTDDPKYQAMQDLRQDLSQRIADRHEGPVVDTRPTLVAAAAAPQPLPPRGENLLAMATLKMRVGTDARQMEREALANNDRVRKARADLAAASAKVASLRADFDKSVRNNEDLKRAREELEDARIARVTAETYLLGTDLAAGFALDFAYHLHRYDYNHYGYGYGYPFYGSYPFRSFVPYYGYNVARVPVRMR